MKLEDVETESEYFDFFFEKLWSAIISRIKLIRKQIKCSYLLEKYSLMLDEISSDFSKVVSSPTGMEWIPLNLQRAFNIGIGPSIISIKYA